MSLYSNGKKNCGWFCSPDCHYRTWSAWAVLGVRPTPTLSHPRGQSPGATQAKGTGGRSGAALMWTQVLGTGSCSGLCWPAAAAACSLLLTLAWMCHGMRARGWTRKGMCWLWEAKGNKCVEDEICAEINDVRNQNCHSKNCTNYVCVFVKAFLFYSLTLFKVCHLLVCLQQNVHPVFSILSGNKTR